MTRFVFLILVVLSVIYLVGAQDSEDCHGSPPIYKLSCSFDYSCPSDMKCKNNTCFDPCTLHGSCGPEAYCHVINHQTMCSCKDGFTGNENLNCSRIECIGPPPNCDYTCGVDLDCPSSEQCKNSTCTDPCITHGPCAAEAYCHVVNREPICSCKDGFAGDPNEKCVEINTPDIIPDFEFECDFDGDCLPDEHCIDGKCINPCTINGTCASEADCQVVNHKPTCSCKDGFTGNPTVKCTQIECTGSPPNCDLGCEADLDCSLDMECKDSVCVDPCTTHDSCATEAYCHVVNHEPVCSCKDGFTGNPNFDCTQIICTGSPPNCDLICGGDLDCLSDMKCRDGVCVDPCTTHDSCATEAYCHVVNREPTCSCKDGFTGNPNVKCTEIKCSGSPPNCDFLCEVGHDCPSDMQCWNSMCINPCTIRGSCATNANCNVINHEPVCSCKDGFTGNPKLNCTQMKCPDSLPNCDLCGADVDCPSYMQCKNSVCIDPCTTRGSCATDATCNVVNHEPVCSCKDGFTGNPKLNCTQIKCPDSLPNCDLCGADVDCPSYMQCKNSVCIDPCTTRGSCATDATCNVVNHEPVCSCKDGFTGDPKVNCTQIKPIPVPVDPCQPSPCGPNSRCDVLNGRANCSCAKNFVGRPPNCRPGPVVTSTCPPIHRHRYNKWKAVLKRIPSLKRRILYSKIFSKRRPLMRTLGGRQFKLRFRGLVKNLYNRS